MRPRGRVAAPDPPAVVDLGRIVNRHGIRGEVRVLPYNPDTTSFDGAPRLCLRAPDGSTTAMRVVSTRRHKNFLLVCFEGVETADDAERLIGRTVCIERDRLPPPDPGRFYHVDLIGAAVLAEDGGAVGTVREVLATGSNDVLVVDGDGREHLIPLIADVVVRIDAPARQIVIRPLPGLLDP